jgi:SecD/SecF fusion protein
MPRAAFSQVVNRSMSEVITRSLATSLCTLLPVVALLIFGGSTLKDFAFALLVGVASGAYSSIFIASPVLTHWKEREAVYRNRRQRIIREYGAVPAYATGSALGDDAAAAGQRRRRRSGILTPDAPGEQISKAEFDALVRDLDIEQDQPLSGRARPPGRSAPGATRTRPTRPAPEAEPDGGPEPPPVERDPTADAAPEDVVMPDRREPRGSAARRNRNRRHGRR